MVVGRRWGLVFVVEVVFEMLDVGEVVCRLLFGATRRGRVSKRPVSAKQVA